MYVDTPYMDPMEMGSTMSLEVFANLFCNIFHTLSVWVGYIPPTQDRHHQDCDVFGLKDPASTVTQPQDVFTRLDFTQFVKVLGTSCNSPCSSL